jgi:polyketide cyclase/dehydrase/lipid transport protein
VIAMQSSVCTEAPLHEVWARLANLEDIRLWSEAIVDARCAEGRERGVGAERTCRLRGAVVIQERWLAWEEGRSFTYEGVGVPLVSHARNAWTVRPEGERTLLVSEAQIVLKGGWVGKLPEPLISRQARRMGRRSLAAFKYLVENGVPAPPPHARLDPTPTAC